MLYTDDPRTGLVLEPLRWARWLRPRWIALEQVPDVLPIWRASAHYLDTLGYTTWAGVLNAANYGVPQTRQRAFLFASLDHPVDRPPVTHEKDPGLFGLKPWITMAEALGYEPGTVLNTRTNSSTIAASRRTGDPGAWREESKPYKRAVDRPSPTVMGNAFRWVWERPATTVVGTFEPLVISAPGWRRPGDPSRQNTPGSVLCTEPEVLTLQSFPATYPVQGPKAARGLQIGNAVPPGLAVHVLAHLTRRPLP